jgi:hypothetical protein
MGVAHSLPADTEFFPCISTHDHGQSVLTLSIEQWSLGVCLRDP